MVHSFLFHVMQLIPVQDLSELSLCRRINSLSCLFLHFIRRFWNQIRTCDSDSSNRLASNLLSCLLMYLCARNSTSNCLLWKSENTALFGGITLACFANFCWFSSMCCSLLPGKSVKCQHVCINMNIIIH